MKQEKKDNLCRDQAGLFGPWSGRESRLECLGTQTDSFFKLKQNKVAQSQCYVLHSYRSVFYSFEMLKIR